MHDPVEIERSPAPGYAHVEDDVMGGDLLDTECPHEEEPRENTGCAS